MQTELFLQARQGDSEALQHLFYQYRPLIYSIKSKYFLRDFDEQDWLQEGLIMFHECLQRFEEEFGTTLGALFKKSFENKAILLYYRVRFITDNTIVRLKGFFYEKN